MKILLTTGIYPPQIGGPATYVPQLSKDLESLGHHITIVTLGEKYSKTFSGTTKIIKVGQSYSVLTRMMMTTAIVAIESLRADRVFSNGLFLETAASICISRKRKGSVVKIVGDPVWERARNQGKTVTSFKYFLQKKLTKKDKALRKIYSIAWARFEYRTAPSEELCGFIRDAVPSGKTIYIPNGVDVPEAICNKRDVDVICVSRLVNWKNVDLAIKAAANLGLSLIVIGDGPERLALEGLAADLDSNVRFLGQLPNEEVSEWLSRSKYFLLLSDYEGLSFALLEAMARSVLPVVSSNEGNLSVVTTGYNGVVIDADEDAIIKTIANLERNPDLVSTMSAAARQHIFSIFNGKIQRSKIIGLMVN